VILAIGQASETAFCRDFCFLDSAGSLPIEKGLIKIDGNTQQTATKGVYAGGDAANGPATVIEAIAAGRRAAISIDQYLGGDGRIELVSGLRTTSGANEQSYDGVREKGFAELERVNAPSLPLSQRESGFAEVELCFSDEQAKAEAHRCLQCDLEICLVKAASARSIHQHGVQ
jgi:NADPH-dependent glutamate synthase beta subunit-like oxidoreductase